MYIDRFPFTQTLRFSTKRGNCLRQKVRLPLSRTFGRGMEFGLPFSDDNHNPQANPWTQLWILELLEETGSGRQED